MPQDEPSLQQIKTAPTSSAGAVPDGDLYTKLKNVNNSLLIITGSKDGVDPFSNDLAILNSMPDASLIRFADVGTHPCCSIHSHPQQ